METQLDFKSKIMLCVLPFIIAGGVVAGLVVPQYNDYNDKNTNLESRKAEQKDLETKLADSAKILKEKTDLENAIAALRGAVPRTPDLELLYIDLERLCQSSGLELLSIAPSTEAKKAEDPKAKGKDAKKDETADVGLVKKSVQIKIYGSYKNLMTLVEKLEHYQRVVIIGDVHMSVPQGGQGQKADPFSEADLGAGSQPGDPDFSHMKLSLTTYYLP